MHAGATCSSGNPGRKSFLADVVSAPETNLAHEARNDFSLT